LNRAHRLNALSYDLIDRLMAALDSIEIDDDARAVILTRAGERAFSAGTDIHEFATSDPRHERSAGRLRPARTGHTSQLESFNKPTIAAINGLAFGDGCEITEAVHLAVASDRALFAKPENNLGMPPTFGGTQRLPRLAGRKRALELLLTGDPFPPARALEIGLVNAVVPHDELLPVARHMARRIIRHSPLAVRGVITAVTRGLNMSIGEGLQVESEQFAALVPSHDLREGLAAWTERRQPNYDAR
jgi:enoyl-CoA hydratase